MSEEAILKRYQGGGIPAFIRLSIYSGVDDPSKMENKDALVQYIDLPVNPDEISVTNTMLYDTEETLAGEEIVRLKGKQTRSIGFTAEVPQMMYDDGGNELAPDLPWVNGVGNDSPDEYMSPERLRLWLDAIQESNTVLYFEFFGTDFGSIIVFVEEYTLTIEGGSEDYSVTMSLKEYTPIAQMSTAKIVKPTKKSFTAGDKVKITGSFYTSTSAKKKKSTAKKGKTYKIRKVSTKKGAKAKYHITSAMTSKKSKYWKGYVKESQMKHTGS